MKVSIIISHTNMSAMAIAEKLATDRNKSYLYSMADLAHRDLHKSSDIYIISEVDTPYAVQIALTIAGWNPLYQKDIIICSTDKEIETNSKLSDLNPHFHKK